MIFFLWFLHEVTFECKGSVHLRKFYSRSTKWRYQGDSQMAGSCTIKLESFPFWWMSTESCVFARLLLPQGKQSCRTTATMHSPRIHGFLHPIRSTWMMPNALIQWTQKCHDFRICKTCHEHLHLLDYSSVRKRNHEENTWNTEFHRAQNFLHPMRSHSMALSYSYTSSKNRLLFKFFQNEDLILHVQGYFSLSNWQRHEVAW